MHILICKYDVWHMYNVRRTYTTNINKYIYIYTFNLNDPRLPRIIYSN